MSSSGRTASPSPGGGPVPDTGSPQSPVGTAYRTVGTALTVVVIGGLGWGLTLTAIKAVAIFTS